MIDATREGEMGACMRTLEETDIAFPVRCVISHDEGTETERGYDHMTYSVHHKLSRDVLFCFLSEVPVTNWAAQ